MLDYRREDPPRTRRIVPLGYVVFGVAVFLLISTIIFSHLANLKIGTVSAFAATAPAAPNVTLYYHGAVIFGGVSGLACLLCFVTIVVIVLAIVLIRRRRRR